MSGSKLERALNSGVSSLRRLLQQGDPTLFVEAIQLSAKTGNFEALLWLLEQGIEGSSEDHIARDAEENTVLHLAAQKGNVDILNLYLSHAE